MSDQEQLDYCNCGHMRADHKIGIKDQSCNFCPCERFEE